MLVLGDELTLPLGDCDALLEIEADVEWLDPNKPSSVNTCPQVRVSTVFLMSKFLPNLKEPLTPRSEKLLIPPLNSFISNIIFIQTTLDI